jgi:hypothetical protein
MRSLCAAVLALVFTVALAACSEVTESEPLPWLRVKKTQHKGLGGFGDGSSSYDLYVKRFGFWWVKLDEQATGNAVALDADTAAISTAQGLKLLFRGADQGALACGSARSAPSIVAAAGVIDCIDIVAGPAPAIASQIRWRRISSAGEALVVEKLTVEDSNRVFMRGMVSFYDAGHQPYFVTMRADHASAPECALVWTANGEMRSLPGPADMTIRQCSDPSPWSKVIKRTLRHV